MWIEAITVQPACRAINNQMEASAVFQRSPIMLRARRVSQAAAVTTTIHQGFKVAFRKPLGLAANCIMQHAAFNR